MPHIPSPALSPESPEGRFLAYVRTGEKGIIQSLIEEFADSSYNLARNILGHADGAEDAVQDAYIRLIKSAKNYNGSIPFAAWMGRLVIVSTLNHRERRRSRHTNLSDMNDQGAAAMQNFGTSMENNDSPQIDALRTALNTLPDRYRSPLTLHYFGGFSQSDTAKALGIPLGTVGVYLARGLERLRQKLGRSGFAVTSAGLLTLLTTLPTFAAPEPLKASLLHAASERLATVAHRVSERVLLAKTTAVMSKGSGLLMVAAVGAVSVAAAVLLSSHGETTPGGLQQAAPLSNPPIQVIAPSGLIAHWTFDEGGGPTVSDTSGGGHDGIIQGAAWTDGQAGRALRFNGESDYVEIPDSPILDKLQNDNYSLAAWFKPNSTPQGKTHAENNSFYSVIVKSGRHEGLSYGHDNTFHFDHWLLDPGYSYAGVTAAGSYQPGRYYHVAGVMDRKMGTTTIYVNGIFSGSNPWKPDAASADYDTETWKLGIGWPESHSYRWAADGDLDDVRIYNRALSQQEIQALAADPGP